MRETYLGKLCKRGHDVGDGKSERYVDNGGCKGCYNETMGHWREANREHYKKYQREYHARLRTQYPERIAEYYKTQFEKGNIKGAANYKGKQK